MPKKNPWYSPRRWFSRDKKSVALQRTEIPIAPGSASIDTTLPTFLQLAQSFTTSFGLLPPTIDPKFIDVIFTLSITSPLISQTIFDNITLANSGHIIRLEGASDARIEAAAASLGDLSRRMHPGGTDAWFNVAMYQIFVAGALSHEWVVNEALDGLERSKFVPTQCIRFKPSGNNDGMFLPHQKARGKTIQLNPLTYHYRALIQWENNPYAIPPLFAAIEPEVILRDVRGTIRGIAHKFGLLGLFQILLEQPDKNLDTNESEADYNIRLRAYLADAKKNLEQGFKDGILVGFKDKHQFEHERVTGDARGLADITNIVDIDANSGAKTDPVLHGRNQSRTETQIRQVYRKMVRQLANVRAIPTRSIEQGYALHLALAGFPDVDVSLDWKPIDSLDDLHDEQVKEKRITNARSLYEDGIISQEERAQMLGFDTPDLPEPRDTGIAGAGAFKRPADRVIEMTWQNGAYRRVKKNTAVYLSSPKLDDDQVALWPYITENDCGCNHASGRHVHGVELAAPDAIEKLIAQYAKAIDKQVLIAGTATMEIVEHYLRVSARQTTDEIFAENLYRILSNDFEGQMATAEMKELVESWAQKIYRESLIGAGFELTMGAIAGDFTPVFDPIKDTTTVKFLKDTDLFYMGKYVKRGDSANRMKKKIIEDYIGVGRDFSDKKFVQGVADTLNIERWQAQRIIRTTSNMSRNFASLRMMEQSEVVRTFKIVGPDDRLKCPWCRSMLGREFRVVKAIFRMRSIISGGAQNVPNTAPILVSTIPLTERDDGSKFIDMTDEQLQASGFDTPSYHPNCRDRTAAVIK